MALDAGREVAVRLLGSGSWRDGLYVGIALDCMYWITFAFRASIGSCEPTSEPGNIVEDTQASR